AKLAMRVCEEALERGVFAQAIRPPTVPVGSSRLRLAVMASHTKSELRAAARELGDAAKAAGFRAGAQLTAPVPEAASVAAAADVEAEERRQGIFDVEAPGRVPARAA
ncbi:MAG: 8-amino-7-oxononanoate synthase, partial [Solirubrobacteraceae bacterium]|nr:8-amino-7-oxononanoate synthase [Solirubrobacteraceae bacterium]